MRSLINRYLQHRTIGALLMACVLTLGLTAFWSADTTGHGDDDATNIVAAGGAAVGATDAAPKKKGNRFARFFKAPLRAVANLFDGDDKNQMQRVKEKDVAKFESAPTMRVTNGSLADAKYEVTDGTAREHLARGRALLDQNRLNESIAELSRAASLEPKLAEARNLLAVAYDRKGLHERAQDTYEQALGQSPQDPQALNNLGYSLYLNGNYRAAVERLKRAAKLAPNDERILNNLALAQCRLGKFNDAYKSFMRAGGEYTGRLNTASMLERMGRDAEAIEHYEAARRVQPDSQTALRRLADLYNRVGQNDKAEQTRRTLNGLAPEGIAAR